MPDPITVTIQQACELSGLSRTTIYRLIWDERLATLKVRGRTLITYASLSRILKAA
jgi:excisionase family DNA binding protein